MNLKTDISIGMATLVEPYLLSNFLCLSYPTTKIDLQTSYFDFNWHFSSKLNTDLCHFKREIPACLPVTSNIPRMRLLIKAFGHQNIYFLGYCLLRCNEGSILALFGWKCSYPKPMFWRFWPHFWIVYK